MKLRRLTLARRLRVLALGGGVVFGVVGGGMAAFSADRVRDEMVASRLRLATTVAGAIAQELQDHGRELAAAAARLDGGPDDVAVLRQLRLQWFPGGILHIAGGNGVLLTEPAGQAVPADRIHPSPPLALVESGSLPVLLHVSWVPRLPRGTRIVVALERGAAALDDVVRAVDPGPGVQLRLVDRSGRVLAASGEIAPLRDDRLAAAVAAGNPVALRLAGEDASLVAATVPLRGAPLAVVLTEPVATAYASLYALGGGLAVAAVLLGIAAVVIARGVSRSILGPIATLAASAERLRRGDLAGPIAVSGDLEIEALAATLEAARSRLAATLAELEGMTATLEEQVAERTQRIEVQDAQRKTLVRRLLGAGEEERRRIARELHDEISQLLTVVDLSLERLGGDPAESARCRRLLADAQRELHRVIYDLRPSLLDDLGLASAVGWYATHLLEPAGLEVSLELEPLPPLAEEVEIVAFRICQEITTNVLRHAAAETVAIELGMRDGHLVLAVEDDGRGIAGDRPPGAGIVGMRERAGLVGGTLTVDSEEGMGTRVVFEVPLADDAYALPAAPESDDVAVAKEEA